MTDRQKINEFLSEKTGIWICGKKGKYGYICHSKHKSGMMPSDFFTPDGMVRLMEWLKDKMVPVAKYEKMKGKRVF